ncbi:hypothetical protein EDB83DRAFT_72042 [Lactarius deliciosus]|nr:hypothetical protein EDB83DRAFT_72042 [Lactarius deliciosus]
MEAKTEETLRALRAMQRAVVRIVVGLTLKVVSPSQVRNGSRLPVVVVCHLDIWKCDLRDIFDVLNGGVIVNPSITLGGPVIYVSMNYRLRTLDRTSS